MRTALPALTLIALLAAMAFQLYGMTELDTFSQWVRS